MRIAYVRGFGFTPRSSMAWLGFRLGFRFGFRLGFIGFRVKVQGFRVEEFEVYDSRIYSVWCMV